MASCRGAAAATALTVGLLAALVVAPPSGGAAPSDDAPSWVSAWGLPVHNTANNTFQDQTVRVVARTSFGGSRVRIRLSNANGDRPLVLESAHIGIAGPGASVQPGTNTALSFGGSPAVTIPEGRSILSDPADLRVDALQDLAISVYAPGPTGRGTGDTEFSTYYVADGNHAADEAGACFGPLPIADGNGGCVPKGDGWGSAGGGYFVMGVDVYAPNDGLIVALGDSITVGPGNQGWPYWLASRLAELAAEGGPRLSIVNMGISGNRVTYDHPTSGVSAQHRLQRDVLEQTGLSGVLMLEGINDVGNLGGAAPVDAATISGALRDIVDRVRGSGADILVSPLTPAGDVERPSPYGLNYSSPEGVRVRHDVNAWLRGKSEAYDAGLDFDAVVRDSQFPDHLADEYDSGDRLHPNVLGQRAMAASIAQSVLQRFARARSACRTKSIHRGRAQGASRSAVRARPCRDPA